MTPEIKKLLRDFQEQFAIDFIRAKASGAIPDGTTDIVIARCVLQITAAKYEPLLRDHRKILANLRYFI